MLNAGAWGLGGYFGVAAMHIEAITLAYALAAVLLSGLFLATVSAKR
jgi:hypothetical protein